jgi:hypothetical protein
MHTFKSEFIDGKKNILIPALQRDYVQGGRTDVINPFIDELLSALKGAKKLDLNYIYGSYEGLEKNDFVPIDGQQRLITLWLIYLYLYKKQGKDFQVKLRFNSREFANAFSEKLLDKLQNFMNSTELKNDIIDASWFVSGWQHDVTVCNMLNTLNLLAERCKELNISEYKNYDNINFSFLDIKNEGLTDDIYVKMNGRGKPLTYFENLKSWMDGKVIELFGEESFFTKEWQTKIDNEWTDFFWENRNKKQEHPEEIDDEQTRFFYSLLLLYWIKNKENLLQEHSNNKINGLNTFLGLSEDNKDKDTIKNKIFEILQEEKILIPLYWIEEIGLYNKYVFEFISKAFANLCDLNTKELLTSISSSAKYLDLVVNKDDETTLMYKLSMANATYAKTLPYLYALIKTPELCKNDEDFKRWLRLIRNLVVNSTIGRDNLAKVCECIDSINNSIKQDFYASIPDLSNLSGFEKEQLNEEKAKAQQILNGEQRSDGKTWEEIIVEAENYAFFKGAIRFLFRDEKGELSDWNNFNAKWEKAQEYFDKPDNNRDVIKDSKQNKYNLLMSFISKLKYIPDNKCIFDNQEETWKHILTDTNEDYIRAVNDILLGNTIVNESENEEIKRLCKDLKLFKYLTTDFRDSRKRFIHGHWALYPSGSRDGVFLNYKERDVLLHKLDNININNDSFGDFISGWDIWFVYRDKKFQWNSDGNIYLLDPNWNRIPISEESENYKFCLLSTAEMDLNEMANNPKQFTEELDKLIESCPKEETS